MTTGPLPAIGSARIDEAKCDVANTKIHSLTNHPSCSCAYTHHHTCSNCADPKGILATYPRHHRHHEPPNVRSRGSGLTTRQHVLIVACSTNLVIILVMMQVSKKIPFDDPNVLNGVRALYIVSNILIAGVYFYVKMQIDKKRGVSCCST